jgi:large subunit ribosomal protein L32
MAVPKKRRSKSKKRIKKACWKIQEPNLSPCGNCKALIMSHIVCPECGMYNGRQVVKLKTKTKSPKDA